MNKTDKKDFAYFKKCARHWLKFWGLTDYDVAFDHLESDDGTLAWIVRDLDGMCACISLNKNWGETKVTKDQLNRAAFHEVFHLVLGKMSLIGKARWTTHDEFFREEEAVIRIMENCVFQKLK